MTEYLLIRSSPTLGSRQDTIRVREQELREQEQLVNFKLQIFKKMSDNEIMIDTKEMYMKW